MISTGKGCNSFETAFMQTRTAKPEDIDELGHVNNVVYLKWAQDIAVQHWQHIASEDLQSRIIFMAHRHEIDYRGQVLPGEDVEIRTWLGRAKGARFARHFDIRKAGARKPAVQIMTDWVMLDAKTRRPKRVSAETLEAFGVTGDAPV